ncbi:MAG: tryptophan synthase subunit alpha [Burkholderiaceae bacterium]|nr:MAG: tryptophan synthase subunit alpha [Burkholderiaceae bacterium]MBE7426318.1 tryptophan synthase subunit alpha [Ideonella sp.]MCC7287380.1 tryptophan synthase subunit alpha [Burkholderiaceae bacterium]
MSRIAPLFARLRGAGRTALVPFVTAGDPYADATVDVLNGLVEGGADLIELGVPFSDPMADGPVIQKASERALARGIGLTQVLGIVRAFRQRDGRTPIVLMGYANPIERFDQRHGAGAFVREAAAAGVDGVLVVDYPPQECAGFAAQLKAAGIDPIFLLAPTSTDARIQEVARLASGFVYYVSLKGVTGAGHLDVVTVAQALPRIRRHVALPIGVGFGIRDASSARAVAAVADAVIIGARLVQILEGEPRDNVAAAGRRFMAEIRSAIDTAEQGNQR